MKRKIIYLMLAFSFLATNFISCQKKDEGDEKTKDNNYPQYGTGAIKTPNYKKYPTASFPSKGDIPKSHLLKFPSNFIPNQYFQGSCVAHAIAAAVMHDINYAKRKISYSQREKVYPSPAFIYNIGKIKDCKKGMFVPKGLDLVRDLGIPTIEEMPYNPSDCQTLPNSNQLKAAAKTKIKGFKTIKLTPNAFAEAIYAGHTIIVAGEVDEEFNRAFYEGEIWKRNNILSESRHAFVIIGYDFDSQTITAFNSWGDGAKNGRFTIAMDMIGTNHIDEAYIIEPFDSYKPLDADDDNDNDDPLPQPQTEALKLEPAVVDFGDVTQGELFEKSLVITANEGIVVTSLLSEDSDINVQSFSFSLKKGESRKIVLRCKSNKVGALSTRLEINYNIGGESKNIYVPIKAKIIQKEIPPQPKKELIEIDKTELSYYNVIVGEESKNYINFTLLEGDATKVDFQLSGDDAFRTLKTTYLNKVGDKRTAAVIYTPKTAGTHRAILLLTSPNGFRQEVTLYGQARVKEPDPTPEPDPQPQENLSIPSYLNFGTIEAGQKAIRELRITNNGKKSAFITMYFEENAKAYGADVNSNYLIIEPNESKTIKVSFSPKTEGDFQGVFRLSSNGGTVVRVQLSGRAEDRRPQEPQYTIRRISSRESLNVNCVKHETFAGMFDLDAQVSGDYIRFSITKKSGNFIHNGTAYIKENDFCASPIVQQFFSAGGKSINLSIRNTLRVGEERWFYALTISSKYDTNRYYEKVYIKRNW